MNQVTKEAASLLDDLRQECPLVHNITNYVTVNDVANALLAIGASPIMADDLEEAGEIAAMAGALVLNIGTLNGRTIPSMLAAGESANRTGVPVVLDPVGAGASRLRNETVGTFLEKVRFSVLRGNLSEISFAAGLSVSTKGVDSALEDEKNDAVTVAKAVAKEFGCVAAVTGAVDVVSDGTRTVKIYNGVPLLSKVTGTGCMATALVGAFAATGDAFLAAVGGIAAMGIAGEMSFERYAPLGTGHFHMGILDVLSLLDGKLFGERAKLEEV